MLAAEPERRVAVETLPAVDLLPDVDRLALDERDAEPDRSLERDRTFSVDRRERLRSTDGFRSVERLADCFRSDPRLLISERVFVGSDRRDLTSDRARLSGRDFTSVERFLGSGLRVRAATSDAPRFAGRDFTSVERFLGSGLRPLASSIRFGATVGRDPPVSPARRISGAFRRGVTFARVRAPPLDRLPAVPEPRVVTPAVRPPRGAVRSAPRRPLSAAASTVMASRGLRTRSGVKPSVLVVSTPRASSSWTRLSALPLRVWRL